MSRNHEGFIVRHTHNDIGVLNLMGVEPERIVKLLLSKTYPKQWLVCGEGVTELMYFIASNPSLGSVEGITFPGQPLMFLWSFPSAEDPVEDGAAP